MTDIPLITIGWRVILHVHQARNTAVVPVTVERQYRQDSIVSLLQSATLSFNLCTRRINILWIFFSKHTLEVNNVGMFDSLLF